MPNINVGALEALMLPVTPSVLAVIVSVTVRVVVERPGAVIGAENVIPLADDMIDFEVPKVILDSVISVLAVR